MSLTPDEITRARAAEANARSVGDIRLADAIDWTLAAINTETGRQAVRGQGSRAIHLLDDLMSDDQQRQASGTDLAARAAKDVLRRLEGGR